jgi:hypothetical protein
MALERHFERIQWHCSGGNRFNFPVFFPVTGNSPEKGSLTTGSSATQFALQRNSVKFLRKWRELAAIPRFTHSNRTRESGLRNATRQLCTRFSGRQKHSPVSRRTKGRRQGDHESIDWYEIMEVLPTIASDKKSERYQLLEELALRNIEDSAKKKSPDHGAINGREDT